MKKISTHIDGLFVVKREIFSDDRGFFMELWNHNVFKNTNLNFNFTQNNVSKSKKNVIRGLHFQSKPYQQAKYVSVIRGSVLDIVVDIRRKSKTFGSHFSIELLENRPVSLWIPPGCAHGFLSLKDNTILMYNCQGLYSPENEHTIKWNDKNLGIDWGIKNPIISKKDKIGMSLKQYKESNIDG